MLELVVTHPGHCMGDHVLTLVAATADACALDLVQVIELIILCVTIDHHDQCTSMRQMCTLPCASSTTCAVMLTLSVSSSNVRTIRTSLAGI